MRQEKPSLSDTSNIRPTAVRVLKKPKIIAEPTKEKMNQRKKKNSKPKKGKLLSMINIIPASARLSFKVNHRPPPFPLIVLL
jgi:hypothetical protein